MTIIKKILYIGFLILSLNGSVVYATNPQNITDYQPIFFPFYNNHNELRIAIRSYYLGTTLYYLVVNPRTFTTETAPAKTFSQKNIKTKVLHHLEMRELLSTPYMKALEKYTSPPYKLQNYGIARAEKPVKGMFMTVDMCPSHKPFEASFFNALVKLAEKNHQPTPIALSITGLWMIDHPLEFNWLMKQVKKNKLNIIWVNHSFSHVYYDDLPLEKNFLLEPHTNMTQEILATEKLLLTHGQLPSVFFRFPGLVANEKLVLKLRQYGLIPLSADAWLAKDEDPTYGSFILVHGNSNEPPGINKLMYLLQKDNIHWLSLDQAFDAD